MEKFNPAKNYIKSMKSIGYVDRKKATAADYRRIGFKSGLEVHQQLLTGGKLFCRCPAGIYHDNNDYDAEVIRHMRPTLSELGVYDGTALMEFRTRKEIVYRINNHTACTYEVDDTPPFPIDREALEAALKISILCKLNIVGEVHITRKQYLDGSIPTGFQRTAILGVEGEIELRKKKVRLIQLSIEEDSCREISDIGHRRIYKTDRLGMPLIETVTYPDMETPDELAEAADYIRFLNRSSGLVRTGMGAAREDVNVSCEGGSRVEIKGVAHTRWIPELSHVESFRQYALLNIRSLLLKKISDTSSWKVKYKEIGFADTAVHSLPVREALDKGFRVIAINLPGCLGILSHFTQPGRIFADEISDRLKVIACIEKPNMIHSEMIDSQAGQVDFRSVRTFLGANGQDAQVILWGPDDDITTAIETVEERLIMAFTGVPNETRKSFEDGTTMFERVLPGRDRMYPDTDSPPIPLSNGYIESLRQELPVEVAERFRQMEQWGIPADTHKYLLSRNMLPLVEKIADDFGYTHKATGCFLGHTFKNLEGRREPHLNFNYKKIYGLFGFLSSKKIHHSIARLMLPVIYDNPDMEFGSVLTIIGYRKRTTEELLAPVDFLVEKFREIRHSDSETAVTDWLMGQVHRQALGNADLAQLRGMINERISKSN
ncbi:MAG: Glu-tRNA(Gln) amidotransferase subunit GatE [Bacteroidales bacterium]|nr:Glu-tRNA(Gln) amidotransferase subunit GatE [Bacteroidales bacterium]